MKQIEIRTTFKKFLSDIHTPVGIYLRLRDHFRDTILLESTDFHAGENSYSFIGVNAIGGIEIKDLKHIEYKFPGKDVERVPIAPGTKIADELWNFMGRFTVSEQQPSPVNIAHGLFGYTTYDAVQFFDTITLDASKTAAAQGKEEPIPLIRYRLYQYVIAINHFKDELFICENHFTGIESRVDIVEGLIKSRDVPSYPFKTTAGEAAEIPDEQYIAMVKKGIANCHRGDVFQIVLSRRYRQSFIGDEFNVYRALRSINPSPYLFYFDYGDYKLIGSSPESQLIIKNHKAIVHPIAGTFKRTGDDETDMALAEKLSADEKENAEHTMLVDLARNDLSRMCDDVKVTQFSKIQYYSHVIHLVSEVTGTVRENTNPFDIIAATFPAGTLSGAPKYRAMQLIDEYEKIPRSYYGGCIGFMGLDGSCNHAIMIRTFLSRDNTLIYQAGAGIVAVSHPESELQEVNNKLNALKKAIEMAENI